MPRVELPAGHHAIIRDPSFRRRGDVRAVAQAIDREMQISTDQKQQQMQVMGMATAATVTQDVVMFRFLKSWTLTMKDLDVEGDSEDERPAPITLEVIQDLPLRFYDLIAKPLRPVVQEIQSGEPQEGNGEVDPTSAARLSSSASMD